MSIKIQVGGKNKYADREKNGGNPPTRVVPKHKAGDDVVTFDDLEEVVDNAISPLTGKVNDLTEAIVAFQEALKGSPKTEAQIKEMGDRHLY